MPETEETEILSETGEKWESMFTKLTPAVLEIYRNGLMNREQFMTTIFSNMTRSFMMLAENVGKKRLNMADCLRIVTDIVLALGYTLENPHPVAHPSGILWGTLTTFLEDVDIAPKQFLTDMLKQK